MQLGVLSFDFFRQALFNVQKKIEVDGFVLGSGLASNNVMNFFRLFLLLLLLSVAVGGRRRRKHRRQTAEDAVTQPQPPPSTQVSTSVCNLPLLPGCSCSNHTPTTLNVFCNRVGLSKLPSLDFGPHPIHTLSFEGNGLKSIHTGDFFGLKVDKLLLGNNSLDELDLLSFWGLEYHLISLDLSFNQLSRIPTDALRLLRNLRSLSVVGCKIHTLYDNDFLYLTKLEVLSLDKNPLTVIEDDAFMGTSLLFLTADSVNLTLGLLGLPAKDLEHLRGLSFAGSNRLQHLDAGWFFALPSLTSINLDDNDIRELDADVFKGLENTLRTLKLNRNKLKKIPRDALQNLEKLESLELQHNNIKKIYARSFNGSATLISLNLRHNAIADLSPFAFENMPNLEEIDLRNNELITLDGYTFFYPGSRIREVWLAENNWLCNCLLQWIRKEYKKRSVKAAVFVDLQEVRCQRPDYLYGRPLVRVPKRELTCDHDYYYYYDEYEEPIYYN